MATSALDAAPARARALPDVEVAVVGAGPHGLSATTHLRRAGVQAQLFGRPMAFWKTMPKGMVLRSNLPASHMIDSSGPLSVAAFAADTGVHMGQPVLLEHFVQYGSWVAQLTVPDVDEADVTQIARVAGGFSLELEDGRRLTARRVVLAAGIKAFESLPPGFGGLPAGRVSHTGTYSDMRLFAGKRVALVGGGQSSFTNAALMSAHGAAGLEVLVRSEQVIWLRGHAVKQRIGRLGPVVYAPTDVGPLWYSRLVSQPDLFRLLPRVTQDRIAHRSIRPACSEVVRVQLGDVRITTGVEVTGARMDGDALRVSVSDGSEREVDHLMFGTGYDIDMARYAFLDAEILGAMRLAGGYPVLTRGCESSVPGLHVLGAPAAWSFGPIMRFISGSWYGGRAVARVIGGRRARAGAGAGG